LLLKYAVLKKCDYYLSYGSPPSCRDDLCRIWLSCLGSEYWSQKIKLCGFPIFLRWVYLLKVNPEMCRKLYIYVSIIYCASLLIYRSYRKVKYLMTLLIISMISNKQTKLNKKNKKDHKNKNKQNQKQKQKHSKTKT
jgi:hypothetical protein